MFVRTKKGKIFDCVVHEQMGKPIYYPKTSQTNGYIDWNEVYKKSENIIDILEVGDYVNGIMVNGKTNDKVQVAYICHNEELNYHMPLTFDVEDIRTIVTKEQFESMEYRLGE